MSLTITASIVDPLGKPLAGADAQVCLFTLAGDAKVIVSGRTDELGKLSLLSKWLAPADYQPRLQLQLQRSGVFVEVSENPGQFANGVCDFGRVTFNPNQVLKLLDEKQVIDVVSDKAVADGLDAASLLERVTTLESERELLVKDLTTTLTQQAAQALAARTAELNAQRIAEKDALTKQLAQQAAQALAAKVAELEAQRVAEKAALAQQMTKEHGVVLAARDQQLAAATSDVAPETTIEDVARSTAEQLDRVRQSLQTGQSGLRLGKVALQLKVLPGSTGGSVSLPQTRQIEKVGAQALGSLDLAFLPETAAPASRPQLLAPPVLGYTESFARRKLAERRLGAEVVYRLVTSAAEHGRVVFQRPAPEAPVAEGTVVLIAIGRQAEHDPRPT